MTVKRLSASWFVSELSCQRVDCQRVGLSARCLSPLQLMLLFVKIKYAVHKTYGDPGYIRFA